jgi:N-acetylglucosaminyldiphosphoundecaprenol N-acetyl-beta-D-mannosaminyltransferase
MSNAIVRAANLGVTADAAGKSVRGGKGVLGPVTFSHGTLADFEEAICVWLNGTRASNFIIGYVNPHVFNIAWKNRAVQRFLRNCDIAAVDGLGVAIPVSVLTRRIQTRTVMTPLFDRALVNQRIAAENAILIGGDDSVVGKGAEEINRSSSGIRVTVTCSGYEPLERYLDLIACHPECAVILVAMSSPRSEELISAANDRFSGKLLWNIGGGTLHFYAGTQARIPQLVSSIGLQWLWRIIHEPAIAPRYVLGIPLYTWRLIQTLIGRNSQHHQLW